MAASLSGMKKAKGEEKPTLSEKADELLREAMKNYLLEDYLAADKILTSFKRAPGAFGVKERKAFNVTEWKDGMPIYINGFTREQRAMWTNLRNLNTKKMRSKKRPAGSASTSAASVSAGAAKAAELKAKKEAALAKRAATRTTPVARPS
jgi:hypothetical protein